MNLRGAWATFRFELRRTMRFSQLFVPAGLTLFPVGLAAVLRNTQVFEQSIGAAVYLYVTCVRLVPGLALLLWVAPAIHAEVEAKTWTFAATRPHGKSSLLFGKYLFGVVHAGAAGVLALLGALALGQPPGAASFALGFVPMILASSMAYGAVYAVFGVLFLKRGMVFALLYTLLVEVLLTLVPSMFNEITIDAHLRAIWFRFFGSELGSALPPEVQKLFVSSGSVAYHAAVLLIYSLVLLALARRVLLRRQLVVPES